jgi:heme exporter protein B
MNELTLFWSQTLAIVWKDVRCELRTRQVWIAMGMFAVLVLVVFNFAFDLRIDNETAVAPGALWIAFVFASVLGLSRTLAAEQDHGAMDRLLICPVDRKAVYFAKLLGNLIFLVAVEIVAVPIFAALYDLPVLSAMMVLVVLLGTIGVAAVGTLFSAVALGTRAREMLLPLLVFPLIIPIVIAAVKATQSLVSPASGEPPWLGLMAAFDVIFLSISALVFHFVIEE